MGKKRYQLVKDIFEDMLIMRRRMIERRFAASGDFSMGPAQGMVLHIVARNGNLSIKEIAEIMRVSGSAVTQLVDPLVKQGFLQREPDEHDRRTLKISLTGAGLQRHKKIKRFHLENMSRVLHPLNEQELEVFRDLQRKIVGH